MAGEYQVIRSIFEYSMPRLVGWSTMMDTAMETALANASQNYQANPTNPHKYHGATNGRADDVPF